MPEAEVAPGGVRVPGSRLRSALLVLGGRVAELVVVEACAGEVRLLARVRAVVVAEMLVDEVEDECWVDDPDPGREVASAVVDVGVAAVAGAVADVAGDADLQRSGLCPGGEGVELCVEALELAAQDRRRSVAWPSALRWQARACSICSAASRSAPSSMRTA